MRILLCFLVGLAAAPLAAEPLLLWRPGVYPSENLLQGFTGRVSGSEVRRLCAPYAGADLWIYRPGDSSCNNRPADSGLFNSWLAIPVAGASSAMDQELESSPVFVWPERRLACLPGKCPLTGSSGPEIPPGGFTPPAPVNINNFDATDTTILAGQETSLGWSATGVSVCQLGPPGQTETVSASGTQSVMPAQTTIYELNCSGAGGSDSAQVLVTVTQAPEAPAIVSFAASPGNILAGNNALLSWISTNASSCAIEGVASNLRASGNVLVRPASTTTYRLVCSGPGGSAQRLRKIIVTPADLPAAISDFSAVPTSIRQGQTTTLSWKSSNADVCEIASENKRWRVKVDTSGSYRLAPDETDSYGLTCSNAVSKAAETVEVVVQAVSGKVRLSTFSVTRTRLLSASPVQLAWDSDLASSCGLRRNTEQFTSVPPDGSSWVQVDETTTFTASCVATDGQASASQTVSVVDEVIFMGGVEGD